MADAASDETVRARLRELSLAAPEKGYRALHAALQGEEPFRAVGVKRVQKLLPEARKQPPPPQPSDRSGAVAASVVAAGAATPDGARAEAAVAATGDAVGASRITLSRPALDQRFGMRIEQEPGPSGGHAVAEVVPGGLADAWNRQHPERCISMGDVVSSVNGKTTFSSMMEEFKEALSCALEFARPAAKGDRQPMTIDNAEAEKEKAAWEQRRKKVTAALIPGLKKIVDHEFGAGASDRIDRVAQMYQRVGRNEAFEDEGASGRRLAPGYITGLEPALPFHDTRAYPWCAHLERHWKAIWQELQGCLDDESLWTPGAYQASNEAYGQDWKIMGVFTADRWQDERRFAVTTRVLRQLEGVVPSEVFFARMPARTSIAPHSDNLNYILTSHLPLDFEEGSCSITVGKEERHWKHGSMLVLDTCFIHSAKNESGRPRYIMVARFWHPGLADEERRALHLSHQILAGSAQQGQ